MPKPNDLKPYPQPGPAGGMLMRKLVAGMRAAGVELPLDSDILIATSGGLDSVALAHALARYGRRILPRERIALLHINHGWRGAESDADEVWVGELAQSLRVRLVSRKLQTERTEGDSWEEHARTARQAIYSELGPPVLTAHHADDVAETVLWRLLTGAAGTHGGGIAPRHGAELRPALRIRKAELKAYLLEEGQPWREDATNHEGRFLRSRMRLELMPRVEALFPRAVEHLGHLAEQARTAASVTSDDTAVELGRFFDAAGLRARRAHFEAIQHKGSTTLPDGWKLTREPAQSSVKRGK